MEAGPIRVAVMADTHGVLRPEVERILETCDMVIHAGDFDNQMLYHKLDVSQPLFAVRGNNDRGWSGGLPNVKRFEIGGVKFIMAHERVDIPSSLQGVQVAVFGHSHMYYQQEISGRLWLNPGSCGYKRSTLPLSMAVMTIEDGAYEVETIWLEKGYGTPGAAMAQMEKTKVSRYEKQQKRYKQKACEKKAPDQDGQKQKKQKQADPGEERDRLFLIAKIQRLRNAGQSRTWIIKNLGTDLKYCGMIYDICERNPDFSTRHILHLLKEDISTT